MLSHLKERKAEKQSYGHVDSAVDMSPAGFGRGRNAATSMEAGERDGGAQKPRKTFEEDEDEDDDARDKLDAEGLAHDPRFRVNGIVVDHEVKGGARTGWEGVYEIMFKSSTPTGQRVALVLLVMVSMSVVVGECMLQLEGARVGIGALTKVPAWCVALRTRSCAGQCGRHPVRAAALLLEGCYAADGGVLVYLRQR
ncbi:unnamed protein product [Phytophthora fragariaefolia]|uniref:Unnamed protein product n=1 Tax=Phytophthora fragariaefolia TaxID=1490495 RepID=A0A9W6XMI9_9STRA|nr:unnamed protein product [Phytophthora fragariaefolia]